MSEKKVVSGSTTFNPSNTKGQVTIFIIIGIVILFTFAGILFVTKATISEDIITAGEPTIADVPAEFQSIQTYTENCVQQIGKRGLLLLGQQGGYIYPDVVGKFSANNPTDSDGIISEPLKIPYWHYNKNANDASTVSISSLKPPLSGNTELSIENQLNRYVEENLNTCLQDYSPFDEAGFNIDAGNPQVAVKVTTNTVNFLVNLPLTASKDDDSAKMDQFYVKLPLSLQRYYQLAETITNGAKDFQFAERQALDLLQIYSAADPEKLPPTNQLKYDLVPRATWVVPDVKLKFESMLQSNVPFLRAATSSNFVRYEYPKGKLQGVFQQNYDNMILPITGADGLEVSFEYNDWPSYFNLNSDGDSLRPFHQTVDYSILHFSMQQYYTVYDVSYPILATINDPNAFNGEGYTFIIALESNIRSNKPAFADTIIPPTFAQETSLACDEDKRNTQLLKTIVVDGATGEPLEGVRIGFSIPEFSECPIGVTNNQGTLQAKYPAVYGGVVNFVKTDYLSNFYPIDTYNLQEKSAIIGYATADLTPQVSEPVIKLYKKHPVKLNVNKKLVEKCVDSVCYGSGPFGTSGITIFSEIPSQLEAKHEWRLTTLSNPLKETDSAIVTFNRIRDIIPSVIGDEFSTSVSITGQQPIEVELVPGVYEVSAFVMQNDPYTIPTEERCFESTLLGEDCFTQKEITLDSFPIGLLNWDEPKSYLTITAEQLYGASELDIFVPTLNLNNVPAVTHIRVTEDLQAASKLGDTSRMPEVYKQLKPKFK